MSLHELLAARRENVVRRWEAQIQGTIAPDLMAPVELRNHIPEFVAEIIVALRDAAGLASAGPAPEDSPTAAGHGAQRLRLGFSLDSVVREYGALRDAIVAEARDAGLPLTFDELQVVFDCVISGTAHAVSEYARQRDAELLRLANEHFGFIAHELRNPLWSATMALQMLRDGGLLPTESRLVGSLERGLQRARELIDQTLQTARIASGIELRTQSTTLRILFDDLEKDIASDADARSIELQSTIEADEPLDVDVRLVRSALGNLLRNAVKYTKPGGTVHLRGRVASARAVIEVEDCCGGLEPGKVEAAFAPFVRMDNRQSGFGLGLAIAKQAVDAHGGTIRVQNLPGKGCIFVLELPVAAGAPAAGDPG
jgi:signal transduction histidine kinase